MPPGDSLTDAGSINPVIMGVVLIVTLAFGLINAAYGTGAADGVEIRRRALLEKR